MRYVFIISVLCLLLSGKESLAQGDWSAYLCGDTIQDMAIAGNNIWCATEEGGVVRWNRQDETFRQYTTLDGLLTNTVQAIAVDREGTVWIGTARGVQCFDGDGWKTYTVADGLAENDICGIFVDSRNNKWFYNQWLGSRGATRFDGSTWEVFNCEKYPLLGLDNIKCVSESPDGAIWFGSGGGASRFDGESWTLYRDEMEPIHYGVLSISFTDDGSVWFGGHWGVLRWNGNTKTYYNVMELLGYHEPYNGLINEIFSVMEDNRGSLWFRNHDHLISFDGAKWTETLGPHNSPATRSAAVDEDGTLWIGSDWHSKGGGLYRYDGDTLKQFCAYPKYVQCFAESGDGSLWIGGYEGLYRFAGETAIRITLPGALEDDRVYSVTFDRDGVLWLVLSGEEHDPNSTYTARTQGKVASFDGHEWTVHEPMCGFGWIHTTVVVDQANVKWVCGYAGLWSFDGISWKSHMPGENGMPATGSEAVFDVAVDRDNMVWITLPNSPPAWFDGETWNVEPEMWDSVSLRGMKKIAVDAKNNLWFSTDGGVIFQYDRTRWIVHSDIAALDGIAVDGNNSVWASERNAILRYSGSSWERLAPIGILEEARIKGIFADSRDGLWFALDDGLLKYEPSILSVVNHHHIPQSLPQLHTHPNPFNPSTTLSFTLSAPGNVTLTVYDVTGRKVTELVSGFHAAGEHSAVWNAEGCASGVYFSVLRAGEKRETRKILLVR